MTPLLAPVRETHQPVSGSLGHIKKIGKLVRLETVPENLGRRPGCHSIDEGVRRDALVGGSPSLGVSPGDFFNVGVGSRPNPHKTSKRLNHEGTKGTKKTKNKNGFCF
jgi:hypothetical protein